MNPLTVYLILESVAALLFSPIFTVSQFYYMSTVQINPLQLVLVGTILEATVLLLSLRTALATSAALLTPLLPLYGVVLRQVRGMEGTQPAEHVD